MDASMFEGFGSGRHFDLGSMFKTQPLSPRVQTHLQRTYAALTLAVAACALGAAFFIQTHLNHWLSVLGSIACMTMLRSRRLRTGNEPDTWQRLAFLAGFGFFQGAAVGGLVEAALWVDPSIIMTSFLATTVVFMSFSAAALVAKRRSYLFLGAPLMAATSWMALASLLNAFVMRIPFLFQAELYLGLAMFCLWVIVDTQMIVERKEGGDGDFVKHALDLFVDAVAIFVRIAVILLKNQTEQQRRDDDRRSNGHRNRSARS